MSEILRAEFTCDWCQATAMVEVDKETRKREIPPGWGVLLFTVRPGDPDVADWSKHKYHACSRACAGELLTEYYPGKTFTQVAA